MLTTVIGLFETPLEARLVVTGLTNQGLEKTDLGLMTSEQSSSGTFSGPDSSALERKGQERLLDRMRGFGVPMSKLDYYTETVCSGGALVSAKVDSQKAEDIHVSMAEHGALETVEADRPMGANAEVNAGPGGVKTDSGTEGVLADETPEELIGKRNEQVERSLGAGSPV